MTQGGAYVTCGPECHGTWPGVAQRPFHVADCPNALCGAGLEFVHGGKRTAHSWRCTLPVGHAGMHCTPNDSEWRASEPRTAASAEGHAHG